MHTVTKCVPTSVPVVSVPSFLRGVAAQLRPAMFKKVKREWERYVVLLKDATCNRRINTMSEWEVHCSTGTDLCHGLEWTCSCMFYKTYHLPCRHIILMARAGKRFLALPASAVPPRWSVQHAWRILDDLESTIESLTQMIQRLALNAEHQEQSASGTSPAKPEKQVVYIRLRRGEQANHVVLSSSEKYVFDKAMIEPLLEHLSGLPSTEFYSELRAWKEMIETGLSSVRSSDPVNLASDDDDDEDYDDEVETFRDPADGIATLKLIQSMEGVEMNTMYLNEVSPDSILSKATIPEPKPAVPEATIPVAQPKFESGQDDQFQEEPAKNDAAKIMKMKQMRQVDIINMPKLPNLKFVKEILDAYPLIMDEPYLRGRVLNCEWKTIKLAGYRYNFIVPHDLVGSLQATFTAHPNDTVRLSKQEKNKAGYVKW
ncbi:hypothetical protein PHMEG_0003919 [Phytophthora megakarya]|uniref:SWIM-type domain-containing protein n=1 Tax=Phytophthora megakarya TaxID=4795 RepID=A0A225WV65_9STRA|nr:hypothetical protein PHMEG_0003919 [Phytophthora megakarya]